MENTLEDKAKFFVQYWAQKVILYHAQSLQHVSIKSIHDSVINFCSLQLKSYLSITEDDTIEAIKKGCFINVNSIEFFEIEDGLTWRIDFKDKKHHTEPVPSFVIDFLRSKGYALPYMGLSVNKLIEYGWIKLND